MSGDRTEDYRGSSAPKYQQSKGFNRRTLLCVKRASYLSTNKSQVTDTILRWTPIDAQSFCQISWNRWINWISLTFMENSIVFFPKKLVNPKVKHWQRHNMSLSPKVRISSIFTRYHDMLNPLDFHYNWAGYFICSTYS